MARVVRTVEALRTEGWPESCGQRSSADRASAPPAAWHACPCGGVVVVRTRTASTPPASRLPRPAPLRRRGPRGAASAATARGRRGSAKHFRPARPPPLLRLRRLAWPCEGGAGPGGGRRRPPRPAPLARRAPASRLSASRGRPPAGTSSSPALALLAPRRLSKGLGARLGALGSGLGSRENSPRVAPMRLSHLCARALFSRLRARPPLRCS